MPPTRVAQRSGRNRAASVPVSRQENTVLGSLRLKKQRHSSSDVEEDIPPSSLPSVMITSTRGRKRVLSSCAASQADCMANTSASMTVPITDASKQRPQKRQKRSSSTPAAPRPLPLPTQLQSRKRSRSRVGLPTDVESAPPTRVSARLAMRRIHSLVNGHSSDIYAHLAGPDGTQNLLSGPPAGSVTLSTPNATVGPQSVQKPRGRRRKAIDLTDENAKRDLMEEWARMRQSQSTLPLSGIDENVCCDQIPSRNTRKADGTVSSVPLEAITRKHTPDPELMESQVTMLDDSHRGSFSTRVDSDNRLPAGRDGTKIDHVRSAVPPGGGTEQPIIEAPSTSVPDPHVGESSPNDKPADIAGTAHNPDLLQHSASFVPIPSVSCLQGDSVVIDMSMNEQANGSRSVTSDNTSIHLDSGDEEFYMLDIPEIFTLPWEPVASRLYVPSSLGKLISGMKEQLRIEARARRRAEELYQAELSRRISAEKIIKDLRTELEEMARR